MSNIPSKSGYYWMRRVDVSIVWEVVWLWLDDKWGPLIQRRGDFTGYCATDDDEKWCEWAFISPPPEREDDGLDDAAGHEVMSDEDMRRDEQEHPQR